MGYEVSNDTIAELNSQLKTADTSTNTVKIDKTSIGELLNNYFSQTQTSEGKKANVISKEKYTYNGTAGMLIKYDDGTALFAAVTLDNGKLNITQYCFNKEKDIEKERPASVVYNANDAKKKITLNFKYHHNGQVSQKEVLNSQGVVLQKEEYNKQGKITHAQTYDNNGELKNEYDYKYNKDNSADVTQYDKDHKLTATSKIQYAEDGKTKISSVQKDADGNITAETEYHTNNKIKNRKEYYNDGKVKSETEYYDNGVIKDQVIYDEDGNVTKRISSAIDGDFGSSAQISEGDCYLLAAINSIRNTQDGQEILQNLVTVTENGNGEKVYTVKFPGAELAAQGLRADSRIDPDKMYITGEYSFTESEMQEILKQAGKKYSQGDGDVILLEAAFEKYREEVNKTLEANNIDKSSFGEAGLQTGQDINNILSGGQPLDAVFVLTGKQSQAYKNNNVQGGLSYEALQTGNVEIASITQNRKAVSQIDGELTSSQKDLNNMLDDMMNDQKDGATDSIGTACFRLVKENGDIYGHAFTIKSVTEDTVTLINPWHPDQELTMTREEFCQNATYVTMTNTNKENAQVSNNTATNSNQTANNNPDKPVAGQTYVVPKGTSYTGMIKSALEEQGIEPTPENIKKAKDQFEAANPGAVHIYNGKRTEWRGNKFLYTDAEVQIPKFTM